MKTKVVVLLAAACGLAGFAPAVIAQDAPAPPANFTAEDHPWDGGEQINLAWDLSPDDIQRTSAEKEAGEPKRVLYYEIKRAGEVNGAYFSFLKYEPNEDEYEKGRVEITVEKAERGEPNFFEIAAVGSGEVESEWIRTREATIATREPFDGGRFWMLIITVMLCGSVVYFIVQAKRGKPLKVRTIAGLEAVDEAVGRATEMGRSVLFIPGVQDMNDIQTVAAITVLARVSRTAAEFDARVEVPTARSLVMTTARETVQASFLSAGRPDAYNESLIYYVTDEQFGYVAYLSGMMVREKPAACFYMGSFFAESLILAETGNSIGAIQVAGTAQPAQLPFFVAACDYTLIGEEFFAASAYLSGEPDQLGSLKGQDVGKIIVAVLLIIGCILATLASVTGNDMYEDAKDFLTGTVLTG